MSKDLRPSAQWPEPPGSAGALILQRAYLEQDAGSEVWGFSDVESLARLTESADTGVYGIDEAPTTEALRITNRPDGATLIY